MKIENTLSERAGRYGDYTDNAAMSQSLKTAMRASPGWARLSASQKETLDMTSNKIARILGGDPTYADSWVDIVGYVTLVVRELENAQAE